MTKIEKKQNAKRQEIIGKILPLMEEKSFSEISVEDICGAADISVGSFYHYFEKKSDILAGLFTRIDDYMELSVFPEMTAEKEEENLRLFAAGWLRYIENTGLEHSKLISSINATDTTLDGDLRPSAAVLKGCIARGQAGGEFSRAASSDELARLFMIALRGLSVDWTRRNACYSLSESGKTYIDFMLKAMKA